MNNRIKELRELMDLRQSDLAKQVGIDQRTISNYETGKTNPDSDALIRLADFFDVSIDYLLFRSTPSTKQSEERIRLIEKIKAELDSLK